MAWMAAAAAPLCAEPPGSSVPKVVRAEPAPEWEKRFACREGWIGGDGLYSVVLSPRRVLWLFGDTFLGTVKDGRRTEASIVNNTVALQAGVGQDAGIRFVTGKPKADRPTSVFLPADGKGFFWPLAAVRLQDRLYLFLAQAELTGEAGAFGFRHIAIWLAVVENPDGEPTAWRLKQRKLPHAEFRPERVRSWGSAILADGGFLYVYGYEESGKGFRQRRLTVARVPEEKLDDFKAWRFRTSKGWSDDPEQGTPLADGWGTECSVSRLPGGKGYVAVCSENGLSEKIIGRFAEAPEGPWSAPVLLYRCPEMARDKGVFTYAAKAHPWAATGNELVISYCVNGWQLARVVADEKVYRPKFVRVELEPPK
jgi:hypothetical protein